MSIMQTSFATLITALAAFAQPVVAGHPVIDGVIGYGVGVAIEKHQEAGERLGYPPLMPPIPGAVSPAHREMIERIEREKFLRELQEDPMRLDALERRGNTG